MQFVAEAFATNWIAPVGPHVNAFAQEFATLVGVPHAAALSSGTAALHLALLLTGVGPGDEVIVSTLTFSASANPIAYLGGRPIFIDSERASWNMDPGLLAETLRRKARQGRLPKAVILVHLYGQSADIAPIQQACETYGVTLIEDAAEALGSTYHGRSPGTFGQAGIYSFNGNKIITTSLITGRPHQCRWVVVVCSSPTMLHSLPTPASSPPRPATTRPTINIRRWRFAPTS